MYRFTLPYLTHAVEPLMMSKGPDTLPTLGMIAVSRRTRSCWLDLLIIPLEGRYDVRGVQLRREGRCTSGGLLVSCSHSSWE
jgi:hypothetical protein